MTPSEQLSDRTLNLIHRCAEMCKASFSIEIDIDTGKAKEWFDRDVIETIEAIDDEDDMALLPKIKEDRHFVHAYAYIHTPIGRVRYADTDLIRVMDEFKPMLEREPIRKLYGNFDEACDVFDRIMVHIAKYGNGNYAFDFNSHRDSYKSVEKEAASLYQQGLIDEVERCSMVLHDRIVRVSYGIPQALRCRSFYSHNFMSALGRMMQDAFPNYPSPPE